MLIIYAPAGANCNYIVAIINNTTSEIKKEIVYHSLGTHTGKIKVVQGHENLEDIKKYIDKNIGIGCLFHHWRNEYDEFLNKENVEPFQIYIDDYKEIVVINWFEKFLCNPVFETDKIASQKWMSIQDKQWKNYTRFVGERAVTHWIYRVHSNLVEGFENHTLFEKKFNFSSMYKSFELTQKEFKKFDTDYTENMYNNWKDSQKIPIESWIQIKNNIETPKNLEHFYQRGIAIALNGLKNNLNEHDCWNQVSLNLQ